MHRKRKRVRVKVKTVVRWNEDSVRRYQEKGKETAIKGEVEELGKNLKREVEESVNKKVVRIKERKIGERDWWDVECRRRKRNVKRLYRDWKRGKREREEYGRGKNSESSVRKRRIEDEKSWKKK